MSIKLVVWGLGMKLRISITTMSPYCLADSNMVGMARYTTLIKGHYLWGKKCHIKLRIPQDFESLLVKALDFESF